MKGLLCASGHASSSPVAALRIAAALAFAAVASSEDAPAKELCVANNTQYLPLDMAGQGRTDEKSAVECQERCDKTVGCRHFSYWKDGGCHLQDVSSSNDSDASVVASWAGVVAGSPSCRAQAATCMWDNTQYLPLDMGGQGRTVEESVDKCQARCATILGCWHFSFWEADGGCHLQDTAALPSLQREVITGLPSCKEQCFEAGARYEPLDMKDKWRSQEVSPMACEARCNSTASCWHFTFWEDGGCHLQDMKAKKVNESGTITGPPLCEGKAPDKHNCFIGLADWKSRWTDAKKTWCCSHRQLGCGAVKKVAHRDGGHTSTEQPRGPMSGPRSHARSRHKGGRHQEGTSTVSSTTTTTTTSTRSSSSTSRTSTTSAANALLGSSRTSTTSAANALLSVSDDEDGVPDDEDGEQLSFHGNFPQRYNCIKGFENWKEAWNEIRQAWCCKHYWRGCRGSPVGKAPDLSELEIGEQPQLRADIDQLRLRRSKTKSANPERHDSISDIDQLRLRRSKTKSANPERHDSISGDGREHSGSATKVATLLVAHSGKEHQAALGPQDCGLDEVSHHSDAQRAWCCTHYGKGCALTTTLAHGGSRAPTTAAPYDCADQQEGWTDVKIDWCCGHTGRGCSLQLSTKKSAHWPVRVPSFEDAATTKALVTTSDPSSTRSPSQVVRTTTEGPPTFTSTTTWDSKHTGKPREKLAQPDNKSWRREKLVSTTEPHDCKVGWPQAWGPAQKDWCCHNYGLGCPPLISTTAKPSSSPPRSTTRAQAMVEPLPQLGGVFPESARCSQKPAGQLHDCDADMANFARGWAVKKKAWCCKHNTCEYETWSAELQEWCCRKMGSPCPLNSATSSYDCHAGASNWERGWSDSKKMWCCARDQSWCLDDAGCCQDEKNMYSKKFDELGGEHRRPLVVAHMMVLGTGVLVFVAVAYLIVGQPLGAYIAQVLGRESQHTPYMRVSAAESAVETMPML